MFEQNILMGPGTEVFSSHLFEIIIMLLGAAIIGFIIGWLFKKSYKEEFFLMKTDHDKCPGIKAGFEKNINDLEVEIANVKAELEKAKTRIAGLITDKDSLQANLDAKISGLDVAMASITKMEAERINLNAEIRRLTDEASKVGAKTSAAFIPDMNLAADIFGKKIKPDDLKFVEGIGPKIEELFHKAGITTWAQLASSEAVKLREILKAGGEQFVLHDPETWPQQANLAAKGLWKELKELQDKLQGGK